MMGFVTGSLQVDIAAVFVTLDSISGGKASFSDALSIGAARQSTFTGCSVECDMKRFSSR